MNEMQHKWKISISNGIITSISIISSSLSCSNSSHRISVTVSVAIAVAALYAAAGAAAIVIDNRISISSISSLKAAEKQQCQHQQNRSNSRIVASTITVLSSCSSCNIISDSCICSNVDAVRSSSNSGTIKQFQLVVSAPETVLSRGRKHENKKTRTRPSK